MPDSTTICHLVLVGFLGEVVGGSFFLLFTEPVVATETGVFPDDCQNVRRTLTIIKSDLT